MWSVFYYPKWAERFCQVEMKNVNPGLLSIIAYNLEIPGILEIIYNFFIKYTS